MMQKRGVRIMQKKEITFETDMTWMRFADLLVDTGVISDIIENRIAKGKPDHGKSGS
jgi:hypothetical protein